MQDEGIPLSPRSNSRLSPACVLLGTLGLLTLGGCGALQVKMGMEVYLAKTPVSSIEVVQQKGPGIAPGQKSSLVVSVLQPNGKVLLTEGAGGGKVMWRDLQVTATVVKINSKGVVSLPRDPRKSDRQLPHVSITIPSQPGVRAELDIPLRYDAAFNANFSGSDGSKGMDGTNGLDGTSGLPGSMDPSNPSAGGNGSDGGNGTDGTNGAAGEDASPVQVQVAVRPPSAPGDHLLLQIGVFAANHKKFFLVDPQGGSMNIRADGGSGGSGGSGGRAGRGGSGGIGSPNGSSGRDGTAGQDGHRGPDGNGGSITVTYDPQAKPYLNILRLSNRGGPRPVFNEAAVAPLW